MDKIISKKNIKKKSSRKKSVSKKLLAKELLVKESLDTYLPVIRTEIDTKAHNIISKFTNIDITALSLDDDIRPVLTVIAADVSGNNHDNAVNNASSLKTVLLALKAFSTGCLPAEMPQLDIFSIISTLSSAGNIGGSLLECIGKNLLRGDETNLFQYGWACHAGASGTVHANLCYDIGIQIGYIQNNIYLDDNYTKLKTMITNLPDNKYRNLLSELSDRIYNETKGIKPKKKKVIKPETLSVPVLKPRKKKLDTTSPDTTSPDINSIQKDIKIAEQGINSFNESLKSEDEIKEQPIKFSTDENEI